MRNAFKSCFERILGLCLVLCGLSLPGQTITGAAVEPSGWVLSLWISGVGTGGAYNYGMGPYETVTALAKLRLRLIDQSWNTDGTPTVFTRNIVGTQRLRLPYPNINTADEALDGGGVRLRIALSEWVYAGTSNIVLSALSGFYAQGGTNSSAASGINVTNLSTRAYQKPYAQWSSVPFQYHTNGLLSVSLGAAGHGADAAAEAGSPGRPVYMVRFWAEDGTNFSPTNSVYAPVKLKGFGQDQSHTNNGPCAVLGYATQLDVSGLANQTNLTVHAAVYPWIGDSSSITKDTTSGYSFPHVEFTPWRMFSDRTGTYPRWSAVVATNGNDTTAALVATTNFNAGSPPAAFATQGGAFNRMVASNALVNGRSDASGCTIYMQAGRYNLAAATISSNNVPETWTTVMPFPGVPRSDVVFTNATSSRYLGHKLRLKDLTIASVGTSGFLGGNSSYAWFDSCLFSSNITDARVVNTVTFWYVTGCKIDKLPQGLAPYTSNDSTPMMVIGNDFSEWSQTTGAAVFPSTILGNYRRSSSNTNGLLQLSRGTWSNQFVPSHPYIAFNEWLYLRVAAADTIQLFNPGDSYLQTNGCLIAQNIFENAGNSANGGRIASICSSVQNTDDSNTPVNNVFLWNNAGLGQRLNLGEAAGGTTNTTVAAVRDYWSVRNNNFTQPNTKHDDKYSPSGIRTNAWPITFGVGWSGNTDMEPQAIDSSWPPAYFGVNSFRTNQWTGSGPGAGWVKWPNFVRVGHQTADGNYGVGNGDYRLGASSGLARLKASTLFPFDIYGNPRPRRGSPAGPVAVGNPRYTFGAFGQ